MKKVQKDKLEGLWERLAGEGVLYLPQEEDGVVNFAPWEKGARVNLEALNTVVPPKRAMFPQTETYMRFETEGKKLNIEKVDPVEENYFLFGVRPCDVAGIKVLDEVFLEEPVDDIYSRRRQAGTILSLGCSEPHVSCFCSAFDLEPAFSPDADVAMWDTGEALLWKPLSEKGEKLTASLDDLLEDASAEEEKTAEELRESVAEKEAAATREHGWNVEGVYEALQDKFDAELWDKQYRRCLGCGICTYICPTCHCFDIEDFGKWQEGERFRCWDSCMFEDFTLHASGENPRPTQKERVRQRFMHKLCYYPSNFDGLYACVGCGRCVRQCPVSIDITQVIKEVGGVKSGS